jgi:hypothetical protein
MFVTACLLQMSSDFCVSNESSTAGLWYPSSRVQTRPKPSDFSGEKILSTPSFGREVKPPVPYRALRHVKEPKSDVEVATFGKILVHFSPTVPASAAGFASVASDDGGLLWRKLEPSKSLVLLQIGGLRCRWQRHSVKPSC